MNKPLPILICPEDKRPCTCATNPRQEDASCPRERKVWIKNEGVKPDLACVHIKLNCNVPDWEVPDIRYWQQPDKWDWQRRIGGIEITHYMIPE